MGDQPDPLEVSAEARLGRTLCEKWTLEQLLGVGGIASVYAARHRNGRRVAVKVLHTELAVDTRIRARFLREGHAASKVEHPGAVAVLDDGVAEDGTAFLVMELLDGETLEQRCQRNGGRVEAADALVIVHALLDVLHSAHAEGVLHRDVTPPNVFITRRGEVKLLDFGIARLRTPTSGPVTKSLAGALGTPGYMPPEQARGLWEEMDGRTDLWAVGAVLFRVVSGSLVHKGRTPSEQLLAAMTSRAPSLAGILTDAPECLVALVARAVAFEPSARFPDARSFQEAVAATHLELTGQALADATRLVVPETRKTTARTASATQPTAFGTTVPLAINRSWSRPVAIVAAISVAGVLVAVVTGRPQQAITSASVAPERTTTPASLPAVQPSATVSPALADAQAPATSGPSPRVKRAPIAHPPRPKSSEDALLDRRQ